MIAASLMGVFGSADEPADFGLDEMAATVELLKPMAVDAAAALALAEARAHQVSRCRLAWDREVRKRKILPLIKRTPSRRPLAGSCALGARPAHEHAPPPPSN